MRQSPKRKTSKTRARRYDAAVIDLARLFRRLCMCNPTRFSSSAARTGQPNTNPALSASSYVSPDDFKHDYFIYNLLRKCKPEASSETAAKAAFDKFKDVDEGLKPLQHTLTWTSLALNEPVCHAILYRASRKIERTIGESLLFGDLLNSCGFSHGATAKSPRVRGESAFKYAAAYPEVTPALRPLAQLIIHCTPAWRKSFKGFTLCTGNRMTTVPKDRDIDRPIACEPQMNMYVQKGVGKVIRDKLRRVGINLNDQTINQRLALEGSIHDDTATVDLASASDSVSLSLCRLLLPEAWYELLLLLRSDSGTLPDGSVISYEKISSMGNGFTFELESLIFWAITQSCEDYLSDNFARERYKCSVYGDDIICRSRTVPLLKMVLNTCGFRLNDDKSFSVGPFRESCGKHYFNGIDVTPVFIRNEVLDLADQLLLANNLRRWNRRTLGVDDPRYTPVYKWLVNQLPVDFQVPRIPDGYGDGALYGTLDEVLPGFNKAGKYYVKTLQRVRVVRQYDARDHRRDPFSNYTRFLDSVYNGYGGLCSWFAQSLGYELKSSDQFERDGYLTTQVHNAESRQRDHLSVPVPGVFKTVSSTIVLREWSDA